MRAFINCNIWKNDATAILVEGNQIIRTGTDTEIKEMITDQDEVIDLNGMFVVPGFVDSHMHLVSLGNVLSNLRLDSCTSTEDLVSALKRRAQETPEGQWIRGRGYNEEKFSDRKRPERKLLDEVCPDHPVILTRACGHVAVINTKGLEAAGITEDSQIDGGHIDFEKGILEENAIYLARQNDPEPDEATLIRWIELASAYCNAQGITSVGSDDFLSKTKDYKSVLNVMEKLSYQGKLNVRVNEQCEFNTPKEFAGFLDDGYTMDVGNDFFRIGPLKLLIDGSLGGRTAAMKKPYQDDPENKGFLTMTYEDILTFTELANKFNMPTIVHAIGDEAVEVMLDIFDQTVLEGNPLHHGLVHCQIMSADQTQRVIDKKLSCYIQPQFIDADAGVLVSRVGEELASTSYPFKTLFENTIASGGSDAPVEFPDPLASIRFACTRKSSVFDARMNQDECMDIDQAISCMSEAGYRQFFMDDRFGKIEEGYTADFAVIDHDITKMDFDDITNAKVMMTVMDGRTVFEK